MAGRPMPLTGVSLVNGLGIDRPTVRDALWSGQSGLVPTELDVPFEARVGAVRGPLPDLPPAIAGRKSRSARMLVHLLAELEEPLARARRRYRPERIAVILGTSTAGADRTEVAWRRLVEQGSLPIDYDLWQHHTYGAMLHVVRHFTGARGPGWMHSTACTSSARCVASARRLMDDDLIDAAIVGGVDTLCAMTLTGFASLDALDPKPCRPFAADRGGINIGEGGALLLVERDGDPMALVEGIGETSDAYHISAPHPEGRGAARAMQAALDDAGVGADAVHHINAHGTGTRHNDAAESKAIMSVFGDRVPVVSTKGYTGHTLGGAGATEVALSLYALHEGWIPASLGAAPVDENIAINVVTERTAGRFERVLSNSFAFGGNNISLLLRAP